MANKIYLGEVEVANTGGGGGGEGYVSDASFNEMTRVAASALLDLKGLEDNIEAFDEKIEGHVSAIDTSIQELQTSKADASSVYDKNERDKTDKVAAAALASLNERVSTLEASSGGSVDLTDYVKYDTSTDNLVCNNDTIESIDIFRLDAEQIKTISIEASHDIALGDDSYDGQICVYVSGIPYVFDIQKLLSENYLVPIQ